MIEKQILVKNPRAIARGSLLVSHAKPTNVDYYAVKVFTIMIAPVAEAGISLQFDTTLK